MLLNRVLMGKYRVEEFLGNGTFGSVFKAHDVLCDRTVAIKALIKERYDETSLKYVMDEMKYMGRLWGHPNIVAIHTVEPGDEEYVGYIVMEYMSGGNLAKLISAGSIPLDRTIRIALQISSALEHAHSRGVIHRDVKPQNVLLDSDMNAKLTDFSVARSIEKTGYLHTVVGTRKYMAPEQLSGNYDHRADIYSLGLILHELVTGRLPFSSDETDSEEAPQKTPRIEIADDLPQELDHIIRKALSANVRTRYQRVADVKADLATVADNMVRAKISDLIDLGGSSGAIEKAEEIGRELGLSPLHARAIARELHTRRSQLAIESEMLDKYTLAKEYISRGDLPAASHLFTDMLKSIAPGDSSARMIEELMSRLSGFGGLPENVTLEQALNVVRNLSSSEFDLIKRILTKTATSDDLRTLREEIQRMKPREYRRLIREYRRRGDVKRAAEFYMEAGRSYWERAKYFRARYCYRTAARMFNGYAQIILKDGPSEEAAEMMMKAAVSYKSAGKGRKGRRAMIRSAEVYRSLADLSSRDGDWEAVGEYFMRAANAYEIASSEVEKRNMIKKAITAYYTAARDALENENLRNAYRLCRQAVGFSSGISQWAPAKEAKKLLSSIESQMKKGVI